MVFIKALVLSCNTGGGHNTAGKAVLEELNRRGIPCEFKDALLFGSKKTSEIVSGAYVNVAKSSPKFFGHLYKAGAAVSQLSVKSPVYYANTLYAKNLYRYILENGFDTLFCPHLFPCEAMTHIKKHFETQVKCYAISTDYTCIPFWSEINVDAFFVPHSDLIGEFANEGIDKKLIQPVGIPVSMKFYEKIDKSKAREMLCLPQNESIYLIMTGSMGFGDTCDLVQNILDTSDENTLCITLVGSNEALKQQLVSRLGDSGKSLCVDFTDNVELYMNACDVLLTKPGGLSSTEAAVANVPLIHTPPIPGCETKNAEFFSKRGVSICGKDNKECAKKAVELAADIAAQKNMQAAQRAIINPFAAKDIVDFALTNE